MQIGFIGTGRMGNPMARNMLKTGHPMVVHDARPAAAENLLELGATWAASPAEVAAASDVVFTSLPGPLEIEAVLTGANGILAGLREGGVYFDLSTNAPSVARRLAEVAAARGVTYLDAPVSGGTTGAEAATLAVMVGGPKPAFDAHLELLQSIGQNVFHLGDVGAGCIAKLVNNLVALSVPHIINEALMAGVKAGLDASTLYDVMSVSSAQRYAISVPRLLERRFDEASFALSLATKDVGLAVRMGRDAGLPMPASAAVEQAMLAACAFGLGEKASNATLLWLESLAGVEVRPRAD